MLIAVLFFSSTLAADLPARPDPGAPSAQALTIPLLFESNGGQFRSGIDFLSRGPGYAIAIEKTQATFSVDLGGKTRNVSMKVVNRCADARGRGEEPAGAVTNYFHGNDPRQWRTNVQTFNKVRYDSIYEGIDLVFHGTNRLLEYDFEVQPGVTPDGIALDFSGMDGLTLTREGDLVLTVAGHELRQVRPVAYQTGADGTRTVVPAAFALLGDGRVGFEIGDYDPTRELVIDPSIAYSTTVGIGASFVRLDSLGNIYVAGTAGVYNVPGDTSGLQPKLSPNSNSDVRDLAIVKLTPDANQIVWATYLGGGGRELLDGFELGPANELYLGGTTDSEDYPLTPGAFSTDPYAGAFTTGAFVTKLAPAGSSIVYSSMLPDLSGVNFKIDALGRYVIAGSMSRVYFVTTRERQPAPMLVQNTDAFLMRLKADGSGLDFSTNFGGAGTDSATGVVIDGDGNIYVAGTTNSLDFPVVNAIQPDLGGGTDAFFAKFSPAGDMQFATYWGGGANETVLNLVIPPDGGVIMAGGTNSPDFPLVSTSDVTNPGFRGYLTRFLPDNSVSLSRFLSDAPPYKIAFASDGKMFLHNDHGPGIYFDRNALNPYWMDPFQSNVAHVVSHGSNFFLVGDSFNAPTQPMPLTYTTGIPVQSLYNTLMRIDVAINGSTLPRLSRIEPEGGRTVGGFTFGVFLEPQSSGFSPTKAMFDTTEVSVDPFGIGTYPAHGPGPVTVQLSDDFGNKVTLQNAFTYVSQDITIDTVTPSRSLFPHDEQVVITGTGFMPGATVSITVDPAVVGARFSNVRVINSNQIIARSTRANPGVYGIRIVNPHRFTNNPDPAFVAFKANAFEIRAPGSVTIAPGYYSPSSQTRNVLLSGVGLNAQMSVFFGGVQAQFVSFVTQQGVDKLTVQVPLLDPGLVDVRIENGTDIVTLPHAFRYRPASPTVNSVVPNHGAPAGGNNVTITGSGFSADDIVQIGNILVTDKTFIDQFTWLVKAPVHHPGKALVVVTNQHGGSNSTGSIFYTYDGPFLTSILPNSGSAAGGTEVTIGGTGFVAGMVAKFGGVAATFVSNSGSAMTFSTPPGAVGLADLELINPDGSRCFIPKGFRYLGDPPTITQVSPNSGGVNRETAVTITGTNFAPKAVVILGTSTLAKNVVVVSSTTITATIPAFSIPSVLNVKVRNADGQEATLAGGFTVKDGPKITTLTPASGPATGGTSVVIAGTNFDPAAQVTFGGTAAASVTFDSATQLTVVTPAHVAADVDVVVTNPQDLTGTKANGFRFLPPAPTITGFTPSTAAPGDAVIITGTNFLFVKTVKFNGVLATFTVDSTTQITATAPGGTSTGQITVETDSGLATSAGTFTLDTSPPTVTSFTPSTGPAGTSVTITGTRFTRTIAVTFGGANATAFTVVSATQLTATAPADGNNGPICVTITGPLTGCSSTDFTMPPRVTTFTPQQGPAGTSVVITGANFGGATAVQFNGVSATPFTVNPEGTQITTTVPVGTTSGPVSVTTPAGVGTSTIVFGVPPTITSFTPDRGAPGSGVTITGTGFTYATSVSFNGAAAVFTILNDTTINATVPAAVTTGPISVTSTPGGTATSATPFTLALTPVITSFTPDKGAPGTVVTISGTNFDGASAVRFNGSPASFSLSSGTITATVPAGATTGPIAIDNPEGTGVSAAYFYLPPVLSSFAPNAGTVGSVVTINGNNFLGATSVSIGAVSAPFTVNSQTKITATIPAGAQTAVLTVTTPFGSVSSSFAYTVLTPTTPTVIATATGPTSVFISWAGDPTHVYDVRRIAKKTDNFTGGTLTRLTGTSFTDTTAAPNTTYLYNIIDVTTGLIGNHDFATTVVFTDQPLAAGIPVRLAHLTQLRTAVNAMRYAAALTPRTWTDPSPTVIRAVHMNELRTGLAEAYISLSRGVSFSDDPVTAGMAVRVTHVDELREAVK